MVCLLKCKKILTTAFNRKFLKTIYYCYMCILPRKIHSYIQGYSFSVVFYFSGHGFEICDKFMLPVDAPGPEDYLQVNALCERELLCTILSSQPKVMGMADIFGLCIFIEVVKIHRIITLTKPVLYRS